MLTMTDAGVGVGVGVGEGVPPLYPLPPQAAQANAMPKTLARASSDRMVLFPLGWWDSRTDATVFRPFSPI
jgi:hypothetical protein